MHTGVKEKIILNSRHADERPHNKSIVCCQEKTREHSRHPDDLLIIISRCQSRLRIAVISIDIVASTRFLQTISRLIDCRQHR